MNIKKLPLEKAKNGKRKAKLVKKDGVWVASENNVDPWFANQKRRY